MTPNSCPPLRLPRYSSLLLLSILSFAVPSFSQTFTAPPPAASDKVLTEFAAATDDVLQQMSQITGLKLRTPLKKTLRSREEIRAYVLRQMDEDKNPRERYSDARAAEAFGLLPKGFDIDPS